MSPFADGSVKAPHSDDDPVFDLIVEKVSRGECVLFLGSAIHSPPPLAPDVIYPQAVRPVLGGELSSLLAARCKFSNAFKDEDPVKNLQRVSLYFEMILSRMQLVEEVRGFVQDGKEPSPMLELLARLKFPLVITTNYDQLFEKALQRVGKRFSRSVYKPDSIKTLDRDYFFSADAQSAGGLSRRRQIINPEQPFILKIHGDIVEDPGSIVITDEDYIQFVLRMGEKTILNPVPNFVREKLSTWSTIFIGYSLKDYNLRLLFKTLRWKIDKSKIPPMYSIDLRPDSLIFAYWANHQRYVTFIVKDLWEFIPRLYAEVSRQHKVPI